MDAFELKTKKALQLIYEERMKQVYKFGEDLQTSPFEWMSILGEEFGELCEAINETYFRQVTHPDRGGPESIIREATQVAATALAVITLYLDMRNASSVKSKADAVRKAVSIYWGTNLSETLKDQMEKCINEEEIAQLYDKYLSPEKFE